MIRPMTRRQFAKRAVLATTLATPSFPFVSRLRAANERLQIAVVGTGNRAGADLAGVAHEHIVALADVDANFMKKAAIKHPQAKQFQDFRQMLEQEADRIDAVVVGTPDHTHAPAAAMAMRLGKHVYCEKPLTHTVHEARVLMQLAKKHQLVTQMGTQIHAGNNYREVVELIRAGTIGRVKRVHVWVNVGTNYSDGSFDARAKIPSHVNWDLWLGPAPERPYSEGIHPFNWRKFWDYGTGRLGDFGCHYLDLVHWALDLQQPSSVEASGPKPNAISPPSWLKVDYHYPASSSQPATHVTWYGAHKPKILNEFRDADNQPIDWGSAQLFLGETGAILSNYSRHLLLRNGKAVSQIDRPQASIPRSIGHHREWTEAVRSNGTTTCNFDYAGHLTQTVLLGSVAFRSGQKLNWDANAGRITNLPQSASLLHKEYRAGWSL